MSETTRPSLPVQCDEVLTRFSRAQVEWQVHCTLPYRHHQDNGTPHADGHGFAWVSAPSDPARTLADDVAAGHHDRPHP